MQTETEEQTRNPLPVWMSIPVILLCLAGGGWIIHWYVMTDPISHESKILGDAPTQAVWPGGGGRNRPGPPVRRNIQSDNNGRLELWTDKAHAIITVAKGKANIRNITYMGNAGAVPDEARNTIVATRSLLKDPQRITAMKLNVAQVKKLDGLSNRPSMVVSPADRDLLSTEVVAYTAAADKDKPGLETKVLQTMDEIAARSVDATKKESMDRVEQINKIITPEMWNQNAAMGGVGK